MYSQVLLAGCVLAALCRFVRPEPIIKRYDGYKVYRLLPKSTEDAKQLKEWLNRNDKYDIWQEPDGPKHPVDIMVSPTNEAYFRHQMTHHLGLDLQLMIPDVHKLIELQETGRDRPARSNYNDTRYYNLQEIWDYMQDMANTCGAQGDSSCNITEIGQSYEGRPILVIKIGRAGASRRSIWIDCGIHAREWISPATCQYIINQLVSGDRSDVNVTALRDAYDWYIHPVVNPDGYDYTWTTDRLWRKTRSPSPVGGPAECIGTDANRNFNVGWGGVGSSSNPCTQTFRGSNPLSEVEVSAIDRFIRPQGRDFDMAITLHSYGQYFVYPWGYTTVEDPINSQALGEVAAIGAASMNAVHNTGYIGRRSNGDMAGNTIDWARGVAYIPFAYLFELRDTGEYGFLLPEDQIRPTGEEVWAGLKSMTFAILERQTVTAS